MLIKVIKEKKKRQMSPFLSILNKNTSRISNDRNEKAT